MFPYERYERLTGSFPVSYPPGEEDFARWIQQIVANASEQLIQLLGQTAPALEILLVETADWPLAPRSDDDDPETQLPYWTDANSPPCIVVPLEIDSLLGELTQEKLAYMIYQAVALAFIEDDPRPWPEDYPLWTDEWQLRFAALWLSYTLDGQQDVVNKDQHEEHIEIFEPELDGKTPDTIRGFDWYDDTSPEEYVTYELLLERFAADLLAQYDPGILPRFLTLYRQKRELLLSDEATTMLATALGSGGTEWLEELVYF